MKTKQVRKSRFAFLIEEVMLSVTERVLVSYEEKVLTRFSSLYSQNKLLVFPGGDIEAA